MRLEGERAEWFRREVLPLEPVLRAYAARFCEGGANEVDDLVHETLAKLLAYEGWADVENASAFAYRVLKNVALHAARRRKIVSIALLADLDSLNLADERPDAQRVIEGREELRLLAGLIASLPPKCRQVFTLRKVYGRSNTEIADQLGLSISTVEKHVIKGLRLCAERLARAPGRRLGLLPTVKKAREWGENG